MSATSSNGTSPHIPATRQRGALELRLNRIGAATRPEHRAVYPPLQLSRTRYDLPDEPGAACLTLVHLGGILEGDRYEIDVALEPGASAYVTTAAATQVYRMPNGDARQDVRLRLAEESRLAWLPEPLVLFGGARFTQTTQIELAPGARLALLDVIAPGRLARGEVHQFDRYEARLEVSAPGGRCLLAERALLEPGRFDPAACGVLGPTPVFGSLYVLGDGFDAGQCCARINQDRDTLIGATLLPNRAGLLVRALGAAPSQVHARLRSLWPRIG